MNTELDTLGGTWRFVRLSSHARDDLEIVLEHATASETESMVHVGDKALGPYSKIVASGLIATIRFERVNAFHSFVESIAQPNPVDRGDGGVMRVLDASLYDGYLRSFVWFDHPMNAGARVYRIGSEDRFVDVFSPSTPSITITRLATSEPE